MQIALPLNFKPTFYPTISDLRDLASPIHDLHRALRNSLTRPTLQERHTITCITPPSEAKQDLTATAESTLGSRSKIRSLLSASKARG